MERFLIPNDSYIDIQKDDVDGKMYITVTVEPKFEPKDGDFLVSYDGAGMLTTCIYHRTTDRGAIVTYAGGKATHITTIKDTGWGYTKDYILASEKQKQDFIDWLEKIGKRWNDDDKCIEDIPQRKFKAGDKVRVKWGISSKTHIDIGPSFEPEMDELIGRIMTVKGYTPRSGYVNCNDIPYSFPEDWLEPWSDEPKKGDLCIFWDLSLDYPHIQFYKTKVEDVRKGHVDSNGVWWRNAIKFDGTREQYDKIREGEL